MIDLSNNPKTFRDQVNKAIYTSSGQPKIKYINITYKNNNYCVIALIIVYERDKSFFFNVWVK